MVLHSDFRSTLLVKFSNQDKYCGNQENACSGKGPLPSHIVCFFFNIVQTAFDPPLFLNIYVADYIADHSAK